MKLTKTLGIFAATVLGAMRVFAEPTPLDDHYYDGRWWSCMVDAHGDAVITGVDDASGDVHIPSAVNGHTVRTIEDEAFYNSDNYDLMTSVEIPNTVTNISGAFKYCSGLGEVTVPGGVKGLEEAFANCWSLEKVVLEEGIAEVGEWAFYGCESLTSVTLPSTVKVIGRYAFYECFSLEEINLPDALVDIGESSFMETALPEIDIPAGVTNIGVRAFCCCNILEVTIPSKVKRFPYAFESCTKLESAVLEEGIAEVSESAFSGCESLASVVLPNTVTNIDSCAFEYCTSLDEIGFPPHLVSIGDHAFFWSALQAVDIPEGVRRIGAYAFAGNDYVPSGPRRDFSCLTEVKLPSTLKTIECGVFMYCCLLESIDIPEGVERIEPWAFHYCENLKTISLPSTVTNIDYRAFLDCGAVTSISVAAGNMKYSSPDGLLYSRDDNRIVKGRNGSVVIPEGTVSIGVHAFGASSSYVGMELTELTLPTTLKEIDNCAFYCCHGAGLVSPELPEGLERIGGYAFCTPSLESVTIPASVRDFTKAFDMAVVFSSLTNVTIAAGVGTISSEGFCEVPIEKIEIPGSVTNIDYAAFGECTSLESVRLNEGLRTIGASAFYNCYSIDAIEIPSSVTRIESSAFGGCGGLSSISLPEGLTEIPSYVFMDCSSLERIEIPLNVIKIGEAAFLNCRSLADVTLPDGLLEIPDEAFSGCKALERVVLPDSVTDIGEKAFYECTWLRSVTIHSSVTNIEDEAFSYCSRLRFVHVDEGDAERVKKMLEKTDSIIDMTKIQFLGINEPEPELPLVWTYTVSDGEATITGVDPAEGDLEMPSSIDGYVVRRIASGAFSGWEHIRSMKLPETLRDIGGRLYDRGAFEGCSGLVSLTIPDAVTNITKFAFRNCTGLESIDFGLGDIALGERVFEGCTSLKEIRLTANILSWQGSVVYDRLFAPNVYIGGPVTNLIPGSVPKCSDTLVIEANVALDLPAALFQGCSLKEARLTNVRSIGARAFASCDLLTSINLPEGLETIGSHAFDGCASLSGVTIPATVTSIGDSAVAGCTSLRSICVADGNAAYRSQAGMLLTKSGADLLMVPGGMAGSCSVPDGVETVKAGAFLAASANLSEIVFPASVTTIEDDQSKYDTCNVKAVVFKGKPPAVAAYTTLCWMENGYYLVGFAADWQQVISFDMWQGLTMSAAAELPSEETGGKAIYVPESWKDELDMQFGFGTAAEFEKKFGTNWADALVRTTGKKNAVGTDMKVWEDFVAGTDPTDVNSKFSARIEMVGGKPVVTWTPALNGEGVKSGIRLYKTYGATTLGGGWDEVADGHEADYNFFRVSVEMP